MKTAKIAVLAALGAALAGPAGAAGLCTGYGPQAPRDIAAPAGTNARVFAPAPPAAAMNLCNIHFHTHAEHKGPGFGVAAGGAGPGGGGAAGGFRCNESAGLTPAERADPAAGHGACHGVRPGDTIEVHWVYSSCAVGPGEGLGACLSPACANPQLRVEAQVFLAVSDATAARFADYAQRDAPVNGLHQPKALPAGTGTPVVFPGSTTGPSYSDQKCSPLQVTWSVRPACARLDIASLHAWCAGNPFKENHAHGVRPLVTAPALLAPLR